ncbi:DUF1064 domain-containing protein [Taylorella asinigenitalis]|uniref:DUF1064 domain-containing protein n=1 Tax=Taylorella asinigenitalis TaxID=84590 RepID=UPI0005D17CFF|nr:DUF1064 domain-containing protein [Taylorella asinigenitalis]
MGYRKYRNQKCECDGFTFDSKREMYRYQELKLLEKAGEIDDVRLQVSFELIPANDDYRAIKYVADFTYCENGKRIVEDVKGFKTKEYQLKKKLMRHVYGIKIREIQ